MTCILGALCTRHWVTEKGCTVFISGDSFSVRKWGPKRFKSWALRNDVPSGERRQFLEMGWPSEWRVSIRGVQTHRSTAARGLPGKGAVAKGSPRSGDFYPLGSSGRVFSQHVHNQITAFRLYRWPCGGRTSRQQKGTTGLHRAWVRVVKALRGLGNAPRGLYR